MNKFMNLELRELQPATTVMYAYSAHLEKAISMSLIDENCKSKSFGTFFPDTGIFFAVKSNKIHLWRKHDGWGFDRYAMEWLEARDVRMIVVKETDEGKLCTVRFKTFYNNCQGDNDGHGDQFVLPRKFWEIRWITDGSHDMI